MATNEMIPFAGQQLPAAFRVPADQMESLSDGIGSSYGVLGYKGKVWSLRLRGERHTFTRPDDGSPQSFIDVIILRQGRQKSKSYYPDGYSPEASDGKRPTCASLNGVTPDSDVLQKQANACSLCPRNVWKVNAQGRKERECTDYKRLAVLLLPGLSKQVLGQPLIEPVFLRVPPASLNDLATFGDNMNAQGYPFWSYVTRISFDPEVAHPKFIFRGLQLLTENEAPVVLEQRDDPQAKRITGEEDTPLAAAPAAQATGLAPPQGAPAATAPSAPTTASLSNPAQATQQAQQAVAPPPKEPERVDTGFGEVLDLKANPPAGVTANGNNGAAPQMQAVPMGAVSDTGDAVDSDAELDAKLQGLFSTK